MKRDIEDLLRRVHRTGRFELYRDDAGMYRFRLKAANGSILAISEAYESKRGAQQGIDSVRRNVSDAALADLTV